MGRRISSQEMADYTNINATDPPRPLNFGKFGGAATRSRPPVEIRKILRTRASTTSPSSARPPRPGDHSSSIFGEWDHDRGGLRHRRAQGRHADRQGRGREYNRLKDMIHDKNVVVGVLQSRPTAPRPPRRPDRRGRPDHLQLLGGAPRRAGRRDLHTSAPDRLLRAVLPPDLAGPGGATHPPLARVPARRHRVERARGRSPAHGTAGHDVTVVSQEPSRATTTSAARTLSGRSCRTACYPRSCSTATRGPKLPRTSPRRSARGTSRPTPRRCAARAAELVFANHVLLGAPVGAASGLPFRVKAHGSELEYSMRGRPWLEEWSRLARGRRGDVRRLAPHPRGARGRRRPGRAGVRCRPASTSSSGCGAARQALPACSPRHAPIGEPGQRRGAAAGQGQRRAARGVLRRGRRSSLSGS